MAATKKKLLVGVITALLVLSAFLVFLAGRSQPPLPNPNGYDDFVKAGQLVTGEINKRVLSEYREMSLDELRAFAVTNAEALKLTRIGLTRKCRMPIEQNDSGEMSGSVGLARMFCLEARLAQLEGRTNDAVISYLDLFRFAHERARGGLIIDAVLIGAFEGSGFADLNLIRGSLTAEQNRQFATVLAELDAGAEPWRSFSKRDLSHALHTEPTSLLSPDGQRIDSRFESRFYQSQIWRRQMIINFAARAYELEKGERPKTINDLVPTYLKTIPQDPLTGTNILYLP